MQRGPGQLSSVSDLYVSDEISVLLEEIHDLEPKGHIAPIDDEQEFEINGSQTGGSWLEVTNSMAGTPGSWDSHANYKHQEAARARYNGVVLHYDKKPMKTPSGVIRVLLLVSMFAPNVRTAVSPSTVPVDLACGLLVFYIIDRLRGEPLRPPLPPFSKKTSLP